MPPSSSFGSLLDSLHEYILAQAKPITHSNWPFFFLLPLSPLYVQAYLTFIPKTRTARFAIGALGLALLSHAWTSYRFHDRQWNAFNDGVTIAFLHLALKYVEFALLAEPLRDPYVQARGRPLWLAAFDLCINSRMVSLGSVGLDIAAGSPNHTLTSPTIERHLPRPTVVRSRAYAIVRHLLLAAAYYVVLDTILGVLGRVGSDTIGHREGILGSLDVFASSTVFVLLPRVPWAAFVVPSWAVVLCVKICVPVVIWQSLSAGYHVFATLAIGSGLYETECWEIDLFDAPWRADSIIDLWGRRWHQLFRHQFISLSAITLRIFHIPISPLALFPLSFFYSGIIHALGELSMDPVPNPSSLIIFFLLSGAGCAIEVAFKRITGKRVRGLAGRIWTWTYMFYIGRIAADAWLDAGVAGCSLLPKGGIGEITAPWLLTWVFTNIQA